jgi:hypothetical protein
LVAEGKINALAILVLTWALVLYFQYRGKQGKKMPELRIPAAVKVIPQLVGRAIEMDRPIHFTSGTTGLNYTFTTATNAAGWSLLGYVAKTCAELGGKIFATCARPDVYLMESEAIRAGNVLAGKPDYPIDVRYISPDAFAYQAAVIDMLKEEEVAVNIMVGFFYTEHLTIGHGAREAGAIGLGGTTNMDIFGLIPTNDYYLLGPENYAAGALLSGDEEMKNAFIGQDATIYVLLGILIIGVLAATAGYGETILNLISM